MALQSKTAQTLSIGMLVAKFCQLSKPNVPGFIKFALIHLVSRVTCYWIPNLVLHLMQKYRIGARWRIQGSTKMPKMEIINEAYEDNLATDVFKYWGVAFLFYKILTLGSSSKKPQTAATTVATTEQPATSDSTPTGSTAGTAEEAPAQAPALPVALPLVPQSAAGRLLQFVQGKLGGDESAGQPVGWSGLRFGGEWPAWWTQLWMVAVGYIGYDAMFYWSHRALHHRSIYKQVHKRHHEFHTPIGPSASHEHPIESTAQLFNWYLPIGFAGWMNGELHWSTLLFYNCFRWLETVDAHSGYELPFSPFHAVPLFGGATMHDYHHRAVIGNFGASFFWDWFCATNKGYWEEVLEEGYLRGGSFVPAPWTVSD